MNDVVEKDVERNGTTATLILDRVEVRAEPKKEEPKKEELKEWSIDLFWLLVAAVVTIVCIAVMAPQYMEISSQGLGALSERFAKRLYRVTGFGFMQQYEGLNKLTLANLASIGLMLASVFAWDRIMGYLLFGWPCPTPQDRRVRNFWYGVGSGLLLCDLAMFYAGLVDLGSWSEGIDYIGAGIATCLYVCVLLCAVYGNHVLWTKAFGGKQ